MTDFTNPSTAPTNPEPAPTPPIDSPSPKPNFIVLISIFVLGLILGALGLFTWQRLNQPDQVIPPEPYPIETAPSPTTPPEPTIDVEEPSPTSTTTGATLEEITYTLPPSWTAVINQNALGTDQLFISPDEGGGYLAIRVHD